MADTEATKTPEISTVTLVSRANYPIVLAYNGENLVIPPHGKARGVDPSKLEGKLPNAIQSIAE